MTPSIRSTPVMLPSGSRANSPPKCDITCFVPTARAASPMAAALFSGIKGASRQTWRIHLAHHSQHVVMILNDWFVILQCQRHAHLPGVSGTLDQALAAPTPDFLFGEFFVDDWPISFSNVVSGQ